MDHHIILKDVSKDFDNNIHVLQNVSYCFEKGKLYCIVGASGAGKTTLLQIMGILDDNFAGEVELFGVNLRELNKKNKARLRNEAIGFVFQAFFLNANLTAVENVMLPMLLTSKDFPQCQKKAESLLLQVGLAKRLCHYPAQLSGGEQQRVSIARALANQPKLILADEPTGNLDEENELKLIELFQALVDQGMTVVMVTHNKTILPYADEILQLENGQLHTYGGAYEQK